MVPVLNSLLVEMSKEKMTWVSKMCSISFFFISLFCIFSFAANDTMIPGQKLSRSQMLISDGGEFALGFFSPRQSKNRYLGIWYNKLQTKTKTVVWVANGDSSLTDRDGAFILGKDGDLAVVDGSGTPYWTTDTVRGFNSSVPNAILMNSGNLMLKVGRHVIWQSFDSPSDTLLPGMEIGSSRLTSWKNKTHPGTGYFSFGIDPWQHKQVIVWWMSWTPYWESGIWDGNIFENIQEVNKSFLFQFTMYRRGRDVFLTYLTSYKYTRLVMDSSGELQFLIWNIISKQWRHVWSTWKDECLEACGPNTSCNWSSDSPVCLCLPGFQPYAPQKWNSGKWSDGCHRKELPCGKEDKFLPLTGVSVYNVPSFENVSSGPIQKTTEK